MGKFKSGGFGGNRSSGGRERREGGRPTRGGFGGRREGSRDSGSFERRKPEMHEVTCAKCGKRSEVPFKPSGDRPVLCRDCFKQGGSSNSTPRSNYNSKSTLTASPSGISQEQFKQLNTKLDKILSFLENIEVEGDEEGFEEEEEEVIEKPKKKEKKK